MAREKLTGIFIPMVTPFNKDESINFGGIKEVTDFLVENGVFRRNSLRQHGRDGRADPCGADRHQHRDREGGSRAASRLFARREPTAPRTSLKCPLRRKPWVPMGSWP